MRRKVVLGSCVGLLVALAAVLRLPGPTPRASRPGPADAAASARASRAAPSTGNTRPPGEAAAGVVAATVASSTSAACGYAGYKQRLDAAGWLGRDDLRGLLGHDAAAVRAVAALAFLDPGHLDEDDVGCVEALLRDGDWSVRFAAGLALLNPQVETRYQIGPNRMVDFSEEARQRLRSTFPIGRIADRLADAPAATRADALRIVAILRADGEHSYEAAGSLVANVTRLCGPVVAVLGDLLGSNVPELRAFAAEMLGRCGPFAADFAPRIALGEDDATTAAALLRMGRRLDEALPVLAKDVLKRRASTGDLWVFLSASSEPRPEEWRPLIPLVRASLGGAGPLSPADAARVACHLGPAADACVPELLRVCGSPDLAPLAICALAATGPSAAAAAPRLVGEIESGRQYSVDPWCVPESFLEILEPVQWGGYVDYRATLVFDTPPVALSAAVLALRAGARVAPRDRGLVSAALRRLGDPDPNVREAATLLLREAVAEGDVAPTPIAARLARDPEERVRRVAASVLRSAAAREEVVSCLAPLLDSGDDLCREYAARALGRSFVESPRAEDALARALESKSVVTRTWAAATLLGSDFPAELRGDDGTTGPWREKAIDVLADSVRAAQDPALRRIAVLMIGYQRDSPAIRGALAAAARDGDPTVRELGEGYLAFVERESRPPAEDDAGDLEILGQPKTADLVRAIVGEPLTPIDVALRALDGEPEALATLSAITADESLLDLERWCATEVPGGAGASR